MTIGIKQACKHNLIRVLLFAQDRGWFVPSVRSAASIFMMHRIKNPEAGVNGHTPEFLRMTLSYLRREGYNLVSLGEIFRRLQNSEPLLPKSVVFTMDDGFLDQATVAAPIFQEFDCPVTIFLITGLLDGQLLPWDARVSSIFVRTKRTNLELQLGAMKLRYDISTPASRLSAAKDYRMRAKLVTEDELLSALDQLAVVADVEVPNVPFAPYLPMTWDMARQLEKNGVSFAPHTVSHGILSRMTPERARYEISESWRRLREELSNPLPLFAYPTGRRIDFGIREIKILQEQGFQGAVTAEPGHADFSLQNDDRTALYQINRYSMPDNLGDVMQYCSWLEQAKETLRHHSLTQFGGCKPMVMHFASVLWDKLGGYRRFRKIDWSRINRLVFVCKGNICRSPYAEIKAESYGIEAVSLGLHAKSGSPANPGAIANAAVRGVELGGHRSRHSCDIEILPGDLLVGMEPWHAHAMLHLVGKSGAQATLMGLWSNPSRPYIHDPYGQEDGYFQTCFSAIDQAIAGMMRNLKVASNKRRNARGVPQQAV